MQSFFLIWNFRVDSFNVIHHRIKMLTVRDFSVGQDLVAFIVI